MVCRRRESLPYPNDQLAHALIVICLHRAEFVQLEMLEGKLLGDKWLDSFTTMLDELDDQDDESEAEDAEDADFELEVLVSPDLEEATAVNDGADKSQLVSTVDAFDLKRARHRAIGIIGVIFMVILIGAFTLVVAAR